MKKALLITLVFMMAVSALLCVGTPRTYVQKTVLSDGSLPNVTNTGAITSPDYIVMADILETPGEAVTTENPAPAGYTYKDATQLCLFRAGNGGTVPYYVATKLQLGTFNTQWLAGNTVQMTVRHIATNQEANWTMVIPAGTNTITILDPAQVIPPAVITDTWTYNLQVNGPAGIAITGPGTYTGTIPQLFTCTIEVNDLLGNWTAAAAPAGFVWQENPIMVEATDFTGAKVNHVFNATIEFVAVPLPDTYTYILHINGPDGKVVTGPVPGTTDYTATDNVMADLLGDYTIGAPDAGYQWDVNPITVDATGWIQTNPPLTKGNVLGSRGGASKEVNYVFEKTIEFTQTLIPPVIVPVDPTTMPAGYPQTNVVNAAYVVTWTGIHDLYIPRNAVDTSAMAYIGGMWVAPDGAPDWTWLNVNFDAKTPISVIVFGPTLPVELSSFTGTMTAEYFVQLNWTTQSESNLIGYRVMRSEGTEVAQATNMTPVLINAFNESTTHNYSFTDTEVENNTVYNYWLESVEMDGSSKFHGPVSVLVEHEVPPVFPTQTTMRSAYPNPFTVNGNTTIEVAVKEGDAGTLTIYNILGQAVKTYSVNPGNINLTWNGKDSKGNTCGSGIYFYRLSTSTVNKTMKMVIVK